MEDETGAVETRDLVENGSVSMKIGSSMLEVGRMADEVDTDAIVDVTPMLEDCERV